MSKTELNRVFVVSEFVDPIANSTGYYWHKIITALSQENYPIEVITTQSSCDNSPLEEEHVKFHGVKDPITFTGNGFVIRTIGNLRLSIRICIAIAKKARKGDVLLCGTNPSFMLPFIGLLKTLIGFRWVLLCNDIFPENLIPLKILSEKSFIYRLLLRIFNLSYRNCDKIIAIGRDMQMLVGEKTENKVPIEYVPNWADLDDVSLEEAFSEANNSSPADNDSTTVFQFFGNMGGAQGLDLLLAAISKCRSNNARFVFTGGGTAVSNVRDFKAEHPNIDIELYPPVAFAQNNRHLTSCDVSLVTLAEGMLGLAVPSKAFFSLAADRPILAIGDKGSELEMIIQDHPFAGWHCSSFDSDQIAATIDHICNIDRASYRNKVREVVEQNFNFRMLSQRYVSIVEIERNLA